MIYRKIRKIFLVISFLAGAGFQQAMATPEQDFLNQAQVDYQTMSDYINGQFAKSMGFFTSLGWNTPPDVFDIVNGPHAEIGIGGGAQLVTVPNLTSLTLGAINLSSVTSMPSLLPAPFPVITCRLGVLNGLDVGVKFNWMPLMSLSNVGFTANYFGWGLDLRYRILDEVYTPTIAVGVSLDSMQGSFSLATGINQISTFESLPVTFTGNNDYTLNWNTRSFGAQLVIGKDLATIFPFAAAGFQRNSGNISSIMKGGGTYQVGNGTVTPISLMAESNGPPVYFEPKFVLGFDFGEGLHWALVGETNTREIAASTSFRAQF